MQEDELIMSRIGQIDQTPIPKEIRWVRPATMSYADELQIKDKQGDFWRLNRLKRIEKMQEDVFNTPVKRRKIKTALFAEYWKGFLENKWKSINGYFDSL